MYKIQGIRSINLKEDRPISTLFGNFGAWFKVYFFIFYLPFSIYIWTLVKSPKVSAFFGRLQMVVMNFVLTHNNPPTENEINSLLIEQVKILLKDHYVLAILVAGVIMSLFIYAICIAGMKHSFYGKINLGDSIKEGVDKIGKTTLIVIITTILGFLSRKYLFTPQLEQTIATMSLTNRLCIASLITVLISMPMMLFSMVFIFSDEGPWWAFPVSLFKSFVKAVAIYYKNILKYIYLFLVAVIFGVVMYFLFRLGAELFTWWVKSNQESIFRYAMSSPDAIKNLIRLFVFILWCTIGVAIYVSCFLTVSVQMSLFILYPELLMNEENKGEEEIKTSELSETFYKQLTTTMASSAANQNIQNAAIPQGPVTPNNGGEGLTVPNSHKNDRPFLNQKIDKEEFDRLTSKE